MIGKDIDMLCSEDISLIENYKEAIEDQTQIWICHHKNETILNKNVDELKKMKLYYNRPASELIFLTRSEHMKIHHEANPRTGRFPNKYKGKSYKKTKQYSIFWLFFYYVVKKMRANQIAELYEVPLYKINYQLKKYGITKELQKNFGINC